MTNLSAPIRATDFDNAADFDDAITAHAEWKMKLLLYLAKRDGSLTCEAVESDHLCALGKWIHGSAKKSCAHLPEYVRLVGEHAQFHKIAGSIVRDINAGKPVTTDVLLKSEAPYVIASRNVLMAILAIKRKVVG